MVPSDTPKTSQDRDCETAASYKVLQNACRRREIDREHRLSVVGELAVNNDFAKKLSSHLLKFLRAGGVVDGLDNSPLFDKSCECSFEMKTAITGIRNFCGSLSRETDEKLTVGSLFSKLRTCYAYDCFKHKSSLGYSLRSRLDRLLWKLIAPIYEVSWRGSSHSSIWGTVESVLWARKPSQLQETFWPGLCLGVLASPLQKSRNEALIQRNESVLPSRMRSELVDTQREIEKSLKFQSFYLVEFLESHTFSWIPQKDIITGFDGILDPNKRKDSRTINVVTSPEYKRAIQKAVLVLDEQQHKASQLSSFTGDKPDEKGSYSFAKLAKTADVDRKRGCANVQFDSSISWAEKANCLLASEGLLDYSTIKQYEESADHEPLHHAKETDREPPPLDFQLRSEKRSRSIVHVPSTLQAAGKQNDDDDLDAASIALNGVYCRPKKEAWSIPTSADATPVFTTNDSLGVMFDFADLSRSRARHQSSPALEPTLGSTAQIVSTSSSPKHTSGEGIQFHERFSTPAGNQTNARDGKRRSHPISPSTAMRVDMSQCESFIANPAADDAGPSQPLSDAFLALAREGHELHATNVGLWTNYVQLKHDLAALEENHRKKVAAFKVLLDREKIAEDEKDEIAGSVATDPHLKELRPPTSGESGVAFLMGFAHYIEDAVGQNAVLVTENDKLQEKISHLRVRHDKLNELAQGLAGQFLESH